MNNNSLNIDAMQILNQQKQIENLTITNTNLCLLLNSINQSLTESRSTGIELALKYVNQTIELRNVQEIIVQQTKEIEKLRAQLYENEVIRKIAENRSAAISDLCDNVNTTTSFEYDIEKYY